MKPSPLFLQMVPILALAACSVAAPASTIADNPGQPAEAHTHTDEPVATSASAFQPLAWQAMPLADVRTGDSFVLSDFAGRVVFLEIIAPGCAPCAAQIKEVRAALQELGDTVVAVAVDYSTSSKPDRVAKYADTLDAGWTFAITTRDFKAALVSDFGPGVVAVSATPVIIVAPSGAVYFTEPGIKDAAALVALASEYGQ